MIQWLPCLDFMCIILFILCFIVIIVDVFDMHVLIIICTLFIFIPLKYITLYVSITNFIHINAQYLRHHSYNSEAGFSNGFFTLRTLSLIVDSLESAYSLNKECRRFEEMFWLFCENLLNS